MSVRTTRQGQVFATNSAGVERMAGWVDRYDPQGRPSRTWRVVLPGGRSVGGFRTRAAAVLWISEATSDA